MISPLTADRKRLVQLTEGMPPLGGTSPLYDAIALAFSMEPAYPLMAEELRHVYAVACYPLNQGFDGRWRRVLVRVTRPGYYAR